MAPEENLCRRSNLYATLVDPKGHHANNYPIPPKGGIYSEHVGKSGQVALLFYSDRVLFISYTPTDHAISNVSPESNILLISSHYYLAQVFSGIFLFLLPQCD